MKSILIFLANYFRFSLVFYFLLVLLLYFGYTAITIDLLGRVLLLSASFIVFSSMHFGLTCFFASIISSLNKSWRNKFLGLASFVVFLFTFLIFSIIAGYFIGISNWGQAVDYKLLQDILLHPFSFIGLIFIHNNVMLILITVFIAIAGLITYYFKRRKDLLVLGDSFGKWKSLGFGFILIPVLLSIATSIVNKKFLRKSVFQKEMFISFLNPVDLVNDMISVKGMGEIDYNYVKVEEFDKKNVIIISVECLRLDHLSFNGYERKTTPYLESLYNSGNLMDVELSTSTCANTFCGILTMLNSCSFENLGFLKFGIHDYLRKQGYHVNFLLSGLHESFSNLKTHYGPSIDTYIESKFYSDFDVNDDEFLFEALNDVEDYSGQPNFFFVHLMSPHIAGYKHDEFKVYHPTFDYKELFKRQKRSIDVNEDAIKLFTNQYDNSILQADDIIRRFIEQLEAKGFMDNAVVAIMGDHGESLGEHLDKFGHKHGLWQEYIGVPVMFIDSDTSFYKEKAYASQIDIAPTLVDRLQLPIPSHWEGKSLKEEVNNRVTYHETRNDKGFRVLASVERIGSKINKFIYIPKTDERFFYDMIADPLEQNNLIGTCENPKKYIDNLLSYKEITSSSLNRNNRKKAKKKGKKEYEDLSTFLSKEMVKNNLNIEGEVFKNYDTKSNENSIISFFTWNGKAEKSNTILIEVKTYPNVNEAKLDLKKNGIKLSPKESVKANLTMINNQDYYYSKDLRTILKFHKNKSIRITSSRDSQAIDQAMLTQLLNDVENSL